jgi:hypothetical protein
MIARLAICGGRENQSIPVVAKATVCGRQDETGRLIGGRRLQGVMGLSISGKGREKER